MGLQETGGEEQEQRYAKDQCRLSHSLAGGTCKERITHISDSEFRRNYRRLLRFVGFPGFWVLVEVHKNVCGTHLGGKRYFMCNCRVYCISIVDGVCMDFDGISVSHN